MNEKQIDTNSAKAWMLASRPKTLTGAAVPVMIGLAFAARARTRRFRLDAGIVVRVVCIHYAD